MEELQKYQELTKLFLKRLIILEKEAGDIQEKLQGNNKRLVEIYIETNIVPLSQMDEILGISDDNVGEMLFDDLTRIIEESKENELDKNINEFIKRYI